MKQEYKKYLDYLQELYKKAIKVNSVETLYTVIQVSGMHFGHWDPTYEIQDFFEDFNKLLKRADKNKSQKQLFRIGLVMYCHAIEMNLAYHVIANLLIIIAGGKYNVTPFLGLWNKRKSTILDAKPPSSKRKLNYVLKLAEKAKENELGSYIHEFYDDKIRNSFYHSDYCITDEEFRYFDGGIATSITLKELNKKITDCFAFYEAFFHSLKWAQTFFGHAKRYHKWRNYELLEIVVNDKKEANGFKVHFSNESIAIFQREKEKVIAQNIAFEKDGSINFFVGDLSKLTTQYMLNGKPYTEKL